MSFANIGMIVAFLDVVSILVASALADDSYHLIFYGQKRDALLPVGFACGIIFVLVAKSLGLYRSSELISNSRPMASVVGAWVLSLLLFALLLFLLKIGDQFSRGAMVLFGFVAPVALATTRGALGITLRHWLEDGKIAGWNAVVIGVQGELTELSPRRLLESQGAREIARVTLPAQPEGGLDDRMVLDDAVKFARANRVEKFLLALPWSDAARCQTITEQLSVGPWQVLLLPDRTANEILKTQRGGQNAPFVVELGRGPLSPGERALKRVFDVVLSTVALVVLSPLLAAVAVGIRTSSPGPAIFRQSRVGFNGREFAIYKFRTMTVMENGPVIRQAQANDERVTAIGRWLRASSIDELPQLINVLRGEMSVIGPRPHAVAHHNEYEREIAAYAVRHNVRPGITGWAQVHGLRGPTPDLELMKRRVDHDLWYIKNWSFWLDLRILVRTVFEMIRARNAH